MDSSRFSAPSPLVPRLGSLLPSNGKQRGSFPPSSLHLSLTKLTEREVVKRVREAVAREQDVAVGAPDHPEGAAARRPLFIFYFFVFVEEGEMRSHACAGGAGSKVRKGRRRRGGESEDEKQSKRDRWPRKEKKRFGFVFLPLLALSLPAGASPPRRRGALVCFIRAQGDTNSRRSPRWRREEREINDREKKKTGRLLAPPLARPGRDRPPLLSPLAPRPPAPPGVATARAAPGPPMTATWLPGPRRRRPAAPRARAGACCRRCCRVLRRRRAPLRRLRPRASRS